jgi:flagellar basal-body rod protein FlgB
MLDDITSVTLHSALTGLAKRQRVIADNIANVETPFFHAGRVSFEGALRSAIEGGGDPSSVAPELTRSTEATREDGNNVSLDEEILSNVETNLQYQLTLRAMDQKFSLLHTAIKGGGA